MSSSSEVVVILASFAIAFLDDSVSFAAAAAAAAAIIASLAIALLGFLRFPLGTEDVSSDLQCVVAAVELRSFHVQATPVAAPQQADELGSLRNPSATPSFVLAFVIAVSLPLDLLSA